MTSHKLDGLLRRIVACGLTACALWGPVAFAGDPLPTPSDFHSIVTLALPDGRSLLGGSFGHFGYSFAVERLNPDGTPDVSFNGTGLVTVPIWAYYEFVETLAVQPDGKIIAGGYAADPIGWSEDPYYGCHPAFCGRYPAVTRLNADGSVDRSFNGNGKLIIDIGDGEVDGMRLALDADGKIVISMGPAAPAATARVNQDGTLDLSFAGTSQVLREFASVKTTGFEYYNASFDHYFLTWVPDEIAKLDAGTAIQGWTRTRKAFRTYTTMQSGTSPVCRFYIPPSLGDSHFFGRGTDECNATAQAYPTFELEDPTFMHMLLPTAGVCPPNTTQVYRVFNNRPDANHRYTTDKAVRDAMVTKGWLAEGDGPDLVVMCAPQ